jgi:hypothetical protein
MLIDYISRRYKFRSNSFGAFGHFVGENKLKIKESNFKLFIGHLVWDHSESVYYVPLFFILFTSKCHRTGSPLLKCFLMSGPT